MAVPGFIFTYYNYGYQNDLVHFILRTIFYSIVLIISANLLMSFVQLVAIKSSLFAARQLKSNVEKWLEKLELSKEQIGVASKTIGDTIVKVTKKAGDKNKEILNYLTNPESMFTESVTLYYLILSIVTAITLDFFRYDASRDLTRVILSSVLFFTFISLLSVKQFIFIHWTLKKILREFRKNNPIK